MIRQDPGFRPPVAGQQEESPDAGIVRPRMYGAIALRLLLALRDDRNRLSTSSITRGSGSALTAVFPTQPESADFSVCGDALENRLSSLGNQQFVSMSAPVAANGTGADGATSDDSEDRVCNAIAETGHRLRREGPLPEDLPVPSFSRSTSAEVGADSESVFHQFHPNCRTFGFLSSDGRSFTKQALHNRLVLVTSARIHVGGVANATVRLAAGTVNNADGVGFLFIDDFPVPTDMRSLISVFVNRHGYVCFRAKNKVVKISDRMKTIQLGDRVNLRVDLDNGVGSATIHPQTGLRSESVTFDYGSVASTMAEKMDDLVHRLRDLSTGCLACVVKGSGCSLQLC